MEEFSLEDPSQLLEAASDFASYPGVHNDTSGKNFLDRYPLPVLISALQHKADVPGLESILVACLERIFKTKYGASLIPQYMPFVQVGLQAESQTVKCLACKTVSCLLDSADEDVDLAVRLVTNYDIYPLLLDCLVDGNELVASASTDAIKSLASSPKGMDIIFSAGGDESTQLGNLAARCSSLGRIRVLALIVKLVSVSSLVASMIYKSNLLSLLEVEVNKTNDLLMTLSVLELLYELAEIPHGTEFLSRATLLQMLVSIISNLSVESILRARAIMIIGRLLSLEGVFAVVGDSSVKAVLSAIDGRLELLKEEDTDECESALEALGQIGSSIQGATMLLSSSVPVARHVVDAAFNRQGRGKQLAALHALGNISGENRLDDGALLNDNAEERLCRMIYETATKSSKLTPAVLLLSVLRQESQIRLAAYRCISALVARPWCLIEVCSNHAIIDIVTDAHIESTKTGMEARYNCCEAIFKALSSSDKLINDPSLTGMIAKLQDAVRRGPYLAKEITEAQPVVVTAERL